MIKFYILVPMACAGLAFAQVTPNSVTVTARRNSNLQPDQVIFAVSVDTPVDATREDVVNALQGLGITLANFSSVTSLQVSGTPQLRFILRWTFNLPAPIANMKSTIGLLSAVQKSLAQSAPSFSMFFGVQSTQLSQQAQQSHPCPLADVIADARAQAQTMAAAAGATLGSILALISGANMAATDPTLFAQPNVSPACTLTVKFALSGGF